MPKIRGVKPDYWTDEDVVELSIPARLLFIGLWNYACDNGHLQDKSKQIKMRILPGDDVNAAELLRELEVKGCIERANGWIDIPNLTKHQKPDKRYWQTCERPGCTRPSDNPERETRSAHHETTPRPRRGPHVVSQGPLGDGDCDGEGEMKVMVNKSAIAIADMPRDDVEAICEHLADRIEANGVKRPTITKAWRDAARLMLDRDERSVGDVLAAINWSQSDEFWRANILSMPKLRQKYDQLRLQANRTPKPKTQQATDDLFARAMQRGESQ